MKKRLTEHQEFTRSRPHLFRALNQAIDHGVEPDAFFRVAIQFALTGMARMTEGNSTDAERASFLRKNARQLHRWIDQIASKFEELGSAQDRGQAAAGHTGSSVKTEEQAMLAELDRSETMFADAIQVIEQEKGSLRHFSALSLALAMKLYADVHGAENMLRVVDRMVREEISDRTRTVN